MKTIQKKTSADYEALKARIRANRKTIEKFGTTPELEKVKWKTTGIDPSPERLFAFMRYLIEETEIAKDFGFVKAEKKRANLAYNACLILGDSRTLATIASEHPLPKKEKRRAYREYSEWLEAMPFSQKDHALLEAIEKGGFPQLAKKAVQNACVSLMQSLRYDEAVVLLSKYNIGKKEGEMAERACHSLIENDNIIDAIEIALRNGSENLLAGVKRESLKAILKNEEPELVFRIAVEYKFHDWMEMAGRITYNDSPLDFPSFDEPDG